MKRHAALPLLLLLFAGLLGALSHAGAAPQGGGKRVTVTLVRWPYT